MKNENHSEFDLIRVAFSTTGVVYGRSEKLKSILKEFFTGLANIPFSNFANPDNVAAVEKLVTKSSETQDVVLGYFVHVRIKFMASGGNWSELVKDFNTSASLIGNDTSFDNKFENYNKRDFKETDFVIIMSLISIFVESGI